MSITDLFSRKITDDMKKLGLGIQDFAAFTAENLIYVDKTELIHRRNIMRAARRRKMTRRNGI